MGRGLCFLAGLQNDKLKADTRTRKRTKGGTGKGAKGSNHMEKGGVNPG